MRFGGQQASARYEQWQLSLVHGITNSGRPHAVHTEFDATRTDCGQTGYIRTEHVQERAFRNS
jgi:hypothetical protein